MRFEEIKHKPTAMIIAKGPSYKTGLRWLEKHPGDVEVWSVNQQWNQPDFRHVGAQTVWELHPYEEMLIQGSDPGTRPGDKDYNCYWLRTQPLAQCPHPVIVHRARPEWPTCIEYPWQVIANRTKSSYHTSSMCYMIAAALYLQYERVIFAGVDLWGNLDNVSLPNATDPKMDIPTVEMAWDCPCVSYWIGRLHERGIKTMITIGSRLYKGGPWADRFYATYQQPYGYEGMNEVMV